MVHEMIEGGCSACLRGMASLKGVAGGSYVELMEVIG